MYHYFFLFGRPLYFGKILRIVSFAVTAVVDFLFILLLVRSELNICCFVTQSGILSFLNNRDWLHITVRLWLCIGAFNFLVLPARNIPNLIAKTVFDQLRQVVFRFGDNLISPSCHVEWDCLNVNTPLTDSSFAFAVFKILNNSNFFLRWFQTFWKPLGVF